MKDITVWYFPSKCEIKGTNEQVLYPMVLIGSRYYYQVTESSLKRLARLSDRYSSKIVLYNAWSVYDD